MLRTKNNSFGVLARIRGLPEKADELRQHLYELVSLTQAESGCLSCQLIENQFDPTEFTLLEDWTNKEAHDSHFGSDLIKSALRTLTALLSRDLNLRKNILCVNSVKYGANSYCLAVG